VSNAQYTPLTPTRVNCRVESRRRQRYELDLIDHLHSSAHLPNLSTIDPVLKGNRIGQNVRSDSVLFTTQRETPLSSAFCHAIPLNLSRARFRVAVRENYRSARFPHRRTQREMLIPGVSRIRPGPEGPVGGSRELRGTAATVHQDVVTLFTLSTRPAGHGAVK